MEVLEKKIRILVCLSVGVLGILAFLIICADGRYRAYKETLGEALTATLLQEMDARNTEAVNISMQYTEERKLQDTVRGSIKSAEGMWYFAVPREKYLYNVGKDPISRDMHSYFMLDTGLKVDSLYLRWCQLLSEESVDCRRLGLRLKSKLPETAAYYPDSVSLLHADSLCTRYAGAYCEVEVVAFSDISRYGLLRWTDWMLMVLAGVCWVALCRCHVFLKRLYQSLFVHRGVQTVIKPVVVERPVVVEKVVFGVGGLSDGSRVYKLDEGVFFDSIRHELYRSDGLVRLLSPQVSLLLRLFLEADAHSLSKEEIVRQMWNGRVSQSNFHKLISALRSALREVSELSVVREGDGSYLLVLR